MKLYSTPEVAAALGIDKSRVRRLAATHRIGQKVGTAWAFTFADLTALRSKTIAGGGRPGPPRDRPADAPERPETGDRTSGGQ